MKKSKKIKIKNFTPSKTEIAKDGTKTIYWKYHKKIITQQIFYKQTGQLQLKVEFSKKGRTPVTYFGYSYIYDLSNKKQYHDAKMVALKSAWGQVPFSPDNFHITGEKYIYVESISS
jgi:hypothetical protein